MQEGTIYIQYINIRPLLSDKSMLFQHLLNLYMQINIKQLQMLNIYIIFNHLINLYIFQLLYIDFLDYQLYNSIHHINQCIYLYHLYLYILGIYLHTIFLKLSFIIILLLFQFLHINYLYIYIMLIQHTNIIHYYIK